MSLLNLLRNDELAVHFLLASFFGWCVSISFIGAGIIDDLFLNCVLCLDFLDLSEEFLVSHERIVDRATADNPSIDAERDHKLGEVADKTHIVRLDTQLSELVVELPQIRTTRMMVLPLTRSPRKHLSTIHLDVWTSRADRTSSRSTTSALE